MKKIFAIMMAVCMVLSAVPFAMAAETDVTVTVGAGGTYDYATFDAAIDALPNLAYSTVTFEIYGKVEFTKTGNGNGGPLYPNAATKTINFVGKTTDAEICMTQSANSIIAAAVNFNVSDLICSRPNGQWVGDSAHANCYFTIWARGAVDGVVTYTNCVFPNGSCNNQYGTTNYIGCEFTNTETDGNEKYNLWSQTGVVNVTGCEFTGSCGIKIYNDGKDKIATTTITDTRFIGLTTKPAIISTHQGTMTLTNTTASGCTYGFIANEINQSTPLCDITIDGETPEYVATYNGNMYTSKVYADEEAAKNNESSDAPAATIADNAGKLTYFATIQSAIDAAAPGATITVLAGDHAAFTVPDTKDGLTIKANEGVEANIIITDTTNGGVKYNASNLTFENLNFIIAPDAVGSTWNISALGYYHEDVYDRENLTVRKCNFVNNSSLAPIGISAHLENYTVTGCTFTNFEIGIHTCMDNNPLDEVTVEDNTFTKVDKPLSVYWGNKPGADAVNGTLNIRRNEVNGAYTDGKTPVVEINEYSVQVNRSQTIGTINVEVTGAEVVLYNISPSRHNVYPSSNTILVYSYFSGAPGHPSADDSNDTAISYAEEYARVGDVFWINYGSPNQVLMKKNAAGEIVTLGTFSVTFADMELTTQYVEGAVISEAPVPVKDGYDFLGWTVNGTDVVEFPYTVEANVTFTALWETAADPTPTPDTDWSTLLPILQMMATQKYSVNIESTEGGVVIPSAEKVKFNGSATVTILPAEGYEIGTVTVNGKEAALNADGTLTIKSITKTQNIEVTFVKLPWVNPYTDVAADDPNYDVIKTVSEAGLINGIGGAFAGGEKLTSAMFVTMLGRLHGVDVSLYTTVSFADVVAGEWYAAYVEWAAVNGITNGTQDGTVFGVEENISIERAVTLLARYAHFAGIDTTATIVVKDDALSDWAADAMAWAIESGIYAPADALNAQAEATRMDIAKMLYNFMQILAK